jgi:tRNA modification GTPase
MYADDTIAAIATAPGQGGIGIVRVSGQLSSQIASVVFQRARPGSSWRKHQLYFGTILSPDGPVIDHGLAVLMHRPQSYTGEDVLELHCHGSPVVLRTVLAAVLSQGARLAEPGEFTKRAFLNGRIDLTQAEAVVDLVRARSSTAAIVAAQQLGGALGAQLDRLRSELVRLKALVEVQIDFSDEDVTVDPRDLLAIADICIADMRRLVDSYGHGKVLRDGVRVAIVGKPNVGKSSLLNALLGEERAIVTELAGTTRDTIEEWADFNGFPVSLTDTAGLREEPPTDPVEQIGIARTSATMAIADMVLVVLDASTQLDQEDEAVMAATRGQPRVLVLNKTDLTEIVSPGDVAGLCDSDPVVRVSARRLNGLDGLRRAVLSRLFDSSSSQEDQVVLTNVRHHDALAKACQSLELARGSMREGQPPDIVAVDVQDSIDCLNEVTGVVTPDTVLDTIFRDFCIGK